MQLNPQIGDALRSHVRAGLALNPGALNNAFVCAPFVPPGPILFLRGSFRATRSSLFLRTPELDQSNRNSPTRVVLTEAVDSSIDILVEIPACAKRVSLSITPATLSYSNFVPVRGAAGGSNSMSNIEATREIKSWQNNQRFARRR